MLIYGYIYFFSLLLIIYIYKYILILLILAEIIVINIVLIMLMSVGIIELDFYVIYYLVFRVCERVLGLRLLVIMVRFSGRDLYYIFNIRKF